jgi:hypothetical protein
MAQEKRLAPTASSPMRVTTAHLSPLQIHFAGHRVFNLSGDLDRYVGTVVDVTERRQARSARLMLSPHFARHRDA